MVMEDRRSENNGKPNISWKDSKQKGEVKCFIAASLNTQRFVLNTDY